MQARGLTIPSRRPRATINSTENNLAPRRSPRRRSATRRTKMRWMPREAKDQELVTLFDHTRDTEVEHEPLQHRASSARSVQTAEAVLRLRQVRLRPTSTSRCARCAATANIRTPCHPVKAESRKQRQKAEGRRQKAEGRKQKAEGRRQW
jgi:hypothetical protein